METSIWSEYFNTDGYYTILFQVIFAFVIGFIFSIFSLGFFLFILVWLITVFLYGYRFGWKTSIYNVFAIFSIFLYGLVGFVIGRSLIGDCNPFRHTYDEWSF